MSKSISARDLLTIPALAELNEISLLHPKLDSVVAPWLYALGIDTDYPVEIYANNHRDMNGKVAVGYRFVGSIRIDREYTNSRFCDTIERVAVTGYTDPSLTRELCEMMGQTVDFKSFNEGEVDEMEEDEFPVSLVEADYESASALMATLENVVLRIRSGTNVVDYSTIDF